MKKNTRLVIFGFIWLLVAILSVVFMLASPPLPNKAPPQIWRSFVQWEPPQIEPEDPLLDPALEKDIVQGEGAVTELLPSETSMEPPPEEGIRIAIIIDDMGLGKGVEALGDLPADVTLSFLPYAPNLQEQVREALVRGHEIMLHLPMEPFGTDNPGPDALLTSLPLEEISVRLNKALGSFDGYIGVNNHMGSKFTRYKDGMELVVDALRERGLFFVDSRTGAGSYAGAIAKQAGLKSASRDIFIDDQIDSSSIETQLAQLEKLARQRGQALAIGHPHALTLSILARWIGDVSRRGVRIVPVSELVK